MKKYFFLATFALALFLSSPVFAFTLTLNSSEATVNGGEIISFEFTVFSENTDRFFIHANGITRWMTLDDIGKVEAGSYNTFKLYASPYYSTGTGTYQVNIEVQSEETGEAVQKSVFITVLKKTYTGIDNIYISGNLEPMGNVDVNVTLRNSGSVPMQNVEAFVLLRSPTKEIAKFNKTIKYINPQEIAYVENNIHLDPLSEYGKYIVEARVFYKNELLSQRSQEFEILPISLVYEESLVSNGLISKEITIRALNYGNDAQKNYIINNTFSDFDSRFFRHISGPVPEIKGNTVVWTIGQIEPGQSATIVYQINYFPIYLVLLIIAFVVWFVLYRIRIVDIRKEIIKKSESDIVIKIEVNNRTGHEIDSVILKDIVPLIFHVKSFIGLKPVRKRTEDGSEIVWRIRKLEKDEERVFSYTINPVIGVVGDIKMPSAKIMYKKGKDVHAQRSNSPVIR